MLNGNFESLRDFNKKPHSMKLKIIFVIVKK